MEMKVGKKHFETGPREIFYLELSDAASYKSTLRSAAMACMLLFFVGSGRRA
jgi:hypothetical protein